MKGIVHHEFVPPNTTDNFDFSCDFWEAWEKMCDKKTELLCNHNWLHHDNVPTHMSPKTTKLVTNNMAVIPHPPYSPELARYDFTLFLKFKTKLKGRFVTVSNIQSINPSA
jgi:histone-lysine N-methyltransferase SETMAR